MPSKSFELQLQYSFVVQDGMAVMGEMEMVTTGEMEMEMMEAMEIMVMAMVAVIRAMDRTAESEANSRFETRDLWFICRDSPNRYTLTCHQIIVICGKNVTVCADLMFLMSNHTSRTMAILKDNMEGDKTATITSTIIITITTTTTILTRLALLDTDDMCKRI